MTKSIRNIANVTHDLMPTVKDLQEHLDIVRTEVRSASDFIRFTDEMKKGIYLIKRYLECLNQDAIDHGIEKVIVQKYDLS